MLFKPLLPPKKGYVESRNSQGNPTYVPTIETLKNQNLEQQTEHESTLLMLAITELAEAQTADQTMNELALSELAGMIGG